MSYQLHSDLAVTFNEESVNSKKPEEVENMADKIDRSVEPKLGPGDKKENDQETYSLHKEGGHSTHRILHSKDLTGAEIMRALTERVKSDPNIHIFEN